MKLFAKKNIAKGLVSVEISPEGVAIAYLTPQPNASFKVCEFHATQNYSQVRAVLAAAVTKNGLAQNSCSLVLHPDHYKLLFINAPSVPESEYRNAARWQIKDMINYSLDDLALDIFYPIHTQTKSKKIYVIAAQKSLLQKMTTIVSECQLNPLVIDVREFAIRNLIATTKNLPEISGFLEISETSCSMVTIQNECVQFVRRIPIGTKTIKETNSITGLTAEIQRSIHYCDTELGQKSAEKYFLPPGTALSQDLLDALSKDLGKEVQIIDLNQLVASIQPLAPQIQERCWPTIGETLRQETENG